jgi:hypothetical protein
MSMAVAALQSSFTVVPPGPVTDRIAVEARVGLRNDGETKQTVRVSVCADERRLTTRTVTVPAGGAKLVSVWWPTTGQAGEHCLSYRVEQDGTTTGRGDWRLRVMASGTPALPLLQGVWSDLLGIVPSSYPRNGEVTEPDLREMVDAMRGLGVTTVIVTYVEYQGHFFYPSKLRFSDRDLQREAGGQWHTYDAVGTILDQADRHGMHVILGLGRGGDLLLLQNLTADAERLRHAITVSKQVAAELWERYRGHPSLYGWYLTHEVNDLATASAYYDPIADFCHALAPDKPVLCAPDGSPKTPPEVLKRSHVDIFAYQDAVGPGYVPYEYTYQPERRLAMLDEVYADYQRRHQGTRKHLWADLELWEMAGPDYANAYPPPWSRVTRQLATECQYVEMITGYEWSGFMQAPEARLQLLDTRARDLFEEYERYLRSRGGFSRPAGN